MTAVKLTLHLPDDLEHEAREAGLLTPECIERWLQSEVRRRCANRPFYSMDRLAALPGSPVTADEIQEEIRGLRAERRRHATPP